ncbi:unnamed protein product [Musa acuminata var. zebrina]
MEFDPSDSSGTDDDLPPPHQNRGIRGGQVTGNGRATIGAIPYGRMQNDMETQIHRLEQEAYSSVLRAFKAQSDAITWEKESLITELRKELRVSDEEHRELLSRVNADDIIRRIREWRQAGGLQSGMFNNVQPDVPVPSPTISASRKRQRTSQPVPSLSLDAPSPGLQSQPVVAPMQPSSSAAKRGTATAAKGKKPKSAQTLPGVSSMKSMQYPSAGPSGRSQVASRNSSGAPMIDPAKKTPYDPLIGRKVMTRWPEDNNFYEAVITDYNPVEGLHALVYDIDTKDETWEWVNLKDISPDDIRWEGGDPGISHRPGQGGVKRSTGRGGGIPGAGRGRGTMKNQAKKQFPPSQNGIGKKRAGDIEILHTETLIKEVEKVFGASHPDPLEIEKAKKLLKEHEQSLIDAIAMLADASDGESAARKRGRPEAANGVGAGSKRLRETDSFQSGIGSKSKPCTKFFSTAGCPFGEGCHFLHYVPGGLQAVAQMTNLGNPALGPPSRNPVAHPAIHDGAPVPPVKTRICNKYNTAEGCKFGEKCHFAHGERELGKPILSSLDGPMAPSMGGRLGGRFELPPPAGVDAAAASFGASATAKISVDASLAGAIIGKGGVNTKQICRMTGAKLSIRDHESDSNLRNIELEGSFDQIKQASAMVRELIVNISASTGIAARNPAPAASAGPGSNYKTKLCENFAKGACTFGDRCHFAHGASELRKSVA